MIGRTVQCGASLVDGYDTFPDFEFSVTRYIRYSASSDVWRLVQQVQFKKLLVQKSGTEMKLHSGNLLQKTQQYKLWNSQALPEYLNRCLNRHVTVSRFSRKRSFGGSIYFCLSKRQFYRFSLLEKRKRRERKGVGAHCKIIVIQSANCSVTLVALLLQVKWQSSLKIFLRTSYNLKLYWSMAQVRSSRPLTLMVSMMELLLNHDYTDWIPPLS